MMGYLLCAGSDYCAASFVYLGELLTQQFLAVFIGYRVGLEQGISGPLLAAESHSCRRFLHLSALMVVPRYHLPIGGVD